MAEHVHVSTLGLCGHLCGIVGESVCLTTLCCVLLYSYICEADAMSVCVTVSDHLAMQLLQVCLSLCCAPVIGFVRLFLGLGSHECISVSDP